MWNILLHRDPYTDTLTLTLSVPDSPFLLLIGLSLLAVRLVVRVYATERTKGILAKKIDFDRFQAAERRIAEANKRLAEEKAALEADRLLLERLIGRNHELAAENLELKRQMNLCSSAMSMVSTERVPSREAGCTER